MSAHTDGIDTGLVHYLSPHGGMIHAVTFTGSLDARGDWAKVTCPKCLASRPPSTEDLIAALAEEPKAMTLSHDRLILQRAARDGGRVVVVRCPHTIGLCFELEEPPGFLGILPCPCNDRSEVVAELVAHDGAGMSGRTVEKDARREVEDLWWLHDSAYADRVSIGSFAQQRRKAAQGGITIDSEAAR